MYACIYIPDFPVQALMRVELTLRSEAVVVMDGVPPLLTVVALNPKARQAGVELGMTAVQVSQLSATVAPVAIRRRSPAQELVAHAALLDLGWSFSPRVEDTAMDTIILDLDGLEPLFKSPQNIAHGLARRALELGLEAHIAVAANPDAARCAARGFPGVILINPGEEAGRLGLLPVCVLAPSPDILETLDRWGVRTCEALAALPTGPLSERLGQEGVLLQKLARGTDQRPLVPIRTALHFEEVMELEHPVDLLEPLLFILGRLLNELCARLAVHGLAASELRLQFDLGTSSEPDLEFETRDSKLEAGSWKLETRNRKLETGNSKFGTHSSGIWNPESEIAEPGPRQPKLQTPNSKIKEPEPRTPNRESRALLLAVPMRDPKVLLRLLQLNLQSDPPPAPILKVAVFAEPAKPRPVQGGLFLPLSPDPEKLEVTLARLAGLVGEGNAGSPELVDTHRPGAFRMRRFMGNYETQNSKLETGSRKLETGNWKLETRNTKLVSGNSNLETHSSDIWNLKSEIEEPELRTPTPEPWALMALRVFRPPLPATVEVRDGRPVRVSSSSGVRGEVVCVAGPWRTSGDWWATEAWEHDEWDVEIRSVVRGPWSVAKNSRQLDGRFIPQTHNDSIRTESEQAWPPRSAQRFSYVDIHVSDLKVCAIKPSQAAEQRATDHGPRTALYRIYHDLTNESWFIRGMYD